MDIKKRIQELSLDQKAKLYFMGLVRKGEIDTLPENPKAAYIKMVMDPSTMHDNPGDIRIDHDYYTEGFDDIPTSLRELSTELGYLKEDSRTDAEKGKDVNYKPHTSKDTSSFGNPNAKMYDSPNIKRNIDTDNVKYKKAEFIYAEGNGQFYALNLYTSKGQKQKLKYDEANEWLKNTLKSFEGVKTTGIDSIKTKKYNSGMEDLDLMVKKLRKLGIEASHNEYDFS